MYLWLAHGGATLQKIEVAARVGLADVLLEHASVAALIARRQRLPGGLAAGELLLGDVEVDRAARDIDLDMIAGLRKGQRPADEALGRDVQDAGTVAGA